MNPQTLPNDIARCNGVFPDDGDHSDWREGCETCLRRTAPRPERYTLIQPPELINQECPRLIEPKP